MEKYKKLESFVPSQPTRDGDSVQIQRIGGQQLNTLLAPYLMLDEMRSDDAADYIGGFPSHPHRGFETIIYMITGRMCHRDHMGNESLIVSGGVPWMTAAKGVIHSEMPEQEEGLLHGFQLWLNLPAAEKLKPSAYQDIQREDIPEILTGNGSVLRVIAGNIDIDGKAASGPMSGLTTEPVIIDAALPANSELKLAIPSSHRTLVYAFGGDFEQIPYSHMGFYGQGGSLQLSTNGEPARALILAGNPIKEPIIQHEPFFMNTVEEIHQAINDYQTGALVI